MKLAWLALACLLVGCATAPPPHPVLICVPGTYVRDDHAVLSTLICYPAAGDRVEPLER